MIFGDRRGWREGEYRHVCHRTLPLRRSLPLEQNSAFDLAAAHELEPTAERQLHLVLLVSLPKPMRKRENL